MIGTLIVAVCFIVALILQHLTLRSMAEERRRLLHMIQAATPAEFVALERAAAPAKVRKPRRLPEDQPAQPYGL
jgi:hypothetical protein